MLLLVVCDLRECNVLIRSSSLLVVLILELPQLATAIRPETVEVAAIRERQRVCFSTRDGNDFLVI